MPLLLALATLAVDRAPDRTLTVVNASGAAVNQLFVGARRTKGWRAKVAGIVGPAAAERDRLEARMLARGESIAIALPGERCRYDLRAVLEDGRTVAVADHDVCAAPRWVVAARD